MSRFALGVPQLCENIDSNRLALRHLTREAAAQGAELILFPEAAPTMLANDDDPTRDLPLGEPIPDGATVRLLQKEAQHGHLWIGFGLLEREMDHLYDSAILLNPQGEIVLHYRRITPGWHGRRADPQIYREGTTLPCAETPWGRALFLICGDLFDKALIQRAAALQPDLLLYPFARSFEEGADVQQTWAEERRFYAKAAATVGALALMSNYYGCDGTFGGAMVVAPDGRILAERAPGRPGLLLWTTP